ncbi:cupin domain-containing protein [Terrisporobacter petrolearius]|nr:cupin domain-containing protein [Terrisporobacter petrolearius]MCC3866235.1 cupin domain-containing protein [Terrisporobacter petrolearius]
MPNIPNQYPYPCIIPPQMYNMYPYPFWGNQQMYYNIYPYYFTHTKKTSKRADIILKDYGPNPIVFNIEDVTKQNNTFRTVLWTGSHLQVTLMSIDVGDDIGLEVHTEADQFIRIEDGDALVQMGDNQYNLDFERRVSAEYAIIIPAGKWHNIINIGNRPIKLYAIYAPPEHPKDTVHPTKADAEAAESRWN